VKNFFVFITKHSPQSRQKWKASRYWKKSDHYMGEIWHFIGPLLQKVFVTGQPGMLEDQMVPFYRNGKVEDIY